MYYNLFRCRGFSMRTVVSHFSSNLTENDSRISQFIRNVQYNIMKTTHD